PGLMAGLASYSWPGNVRELKAVMERAVLLAKGERIETRHLTIGSPIEPGIHVESSAAGEDSSERQRIIDALAACAGNQTRAAERLGISRATLVNKLSIHRIPRPRK